MRKLTALTCVTGVLVPLAVLVAGCSGGGGGGSLASTFQLTSISVATGSVWEINREIEFSFNQPVNFSTVNLNTINVRAASGAPATGSFAFKRIDTDGDLTPDADDPTTVVFQPSCPLKSDLSDAGLAPGGVPYVITVVGLSSGTTNTVRSTSGRSLQTAQSRSFTTPASTQPAVVFTDTAIGPPTPVVRAIGSTTEEASYVEFGGDDGDRAYFEFDAAAAPGSQYSINFAGSLDPTRTGLPLNLFCDQGSKVAVLLVLNQSVNPDSTNIDTSRVRLEFLDGTGTWQPIDTRLELVKNCTAVGANLRLEPIGLLPQASELRVTVLPGFQDLVGETNLLTLNDFGQAPTDTVFYASLTPDDDLADEFLEQFDFGGSDLASFEDDLSVLDTPRADWSGGALTSSFEFNGTGGPNGDFDWVISAGETFNFNTVSSSVTGGPGGLPTTQATFLNGVIDVRDLIIDAGGLLQIDGPNTCTINATRDVIIRGTIDLGGDDARDVITLNTGANPEPGGPGQAGGGTGGTGNGIAGTVTTGSVAAGGPGWGAFQFTAGGGVGGETGFGTGATDNRRPGGGGGGRFGANEGTLVAQNGWNGHPNSTGAICQCQPAPGGSAGPGPFSDGDTSNDGWGTIIVGPGSFVTGELPSVWAGAGGGAGGNAIPATQFPHPSWTISTDEKGGGGGGGAGGLHIKALGRVVFGNAGTIKANGGTGATGENTSGTNHVGGSGGGGSGGHVLIETASQVDFTDGSPATAPARDYIEAKGGVGGIGWSGSNYSKGGTGGPGVIQIHVPDYTQIGTSLGGDIVRPVLATGGLSVLGAPDPINVLPTFGALSKARSKWVSVGGADQNPLGGSDLLAFVFAGTKLSGADAGEINTTAGVVDDPAEILGPEAVPGATVVVEPDEVTLTLSGTSLDPWVLDAGTPSRDIYLRSPCLLEGFHIELGEMGVPSNTKRFEITSAEYDDAGVSLSILVDGTGGTLQDFIDGVVGTVEYKVIPRYFRVSTGGVVDALPDTAFVKILFQATGPDSFGNPDETNILVDWTADISEFNLLGPGELQFFRFEVQFDLDKLALGLDESTQPISIDFLRIPFRF
jgi:hypothetical protein